MAEKIDFFQIYYKEEQSKHFFNWAIPLFNPVLTLFFENTPISRVVLESKAEKIAVCSWNLKNKYKTFSIPPWNDLTYERLEEDYDVLAFTKNSPHHQTLAAMDGWHPGSKLALSGICSQIGLKFPKECKYPIYQNAFCARADVYKAYVTEALIPAMQLMETDPTVRGWALQDSNYFKLKSNNSDLAEQLKTHLGLDYCPLAPFLLERLFSVWVNYRGLNIKTL